MKHIVDAGFLIAAFGKRCPARDWARQILESLTPPLFTCEPALAEASYMTSPLLINRLVVDGDLTVDFALAQQAAGVQALLEKYAPRMDLADACIVRMTEVNRQCRVFTVDRTDFSIYRRNGREVIPCVFPPG